MPNRTPVALALGIALVLAAPAAALDIFNCGADVPPGEVGQLQADLDCTFPTPLGTYAGVILEAGAALQMNGHTIDGSAAGSGVHCMPGRCAIIGPGVITDSGVGITGALNARVQVSGVTLSDNLGMIDVALGRLTLTNVNASQSSGLGIRARKIVVKNVTVDMADAGNCIGSQHGVEGSDLTVSNCHEGVSSLHGSVRLDHLTSVGNSVGVFAGGRVELSNSTVTGNYFPPTHGLDVLSGRPPRLTNTTCDKSARWQHASGGGFEFGPPWGVCSLD